MSEQKHTPGKIGAYNLNRGRVLKSWRLGPLGNGSVFIAVVDGQHTTSPTQDYANAKRLAACWNACDGISTEGVAGASVAECIAQNEKLTAQRDELLAALLKAQPIIEARALEGPTGNTVAEQVRDDVRAAIAKHKQ